MCGSSALCIKQKFPILPFKAIFHHVMIYHDFHISDKSRVIKRGSLLPIYTELAIFEKFLSIFVKGDSKICFDALNGVDDSGSWKIDTFVFYLKLHSCCFCWVRREANNVAHMLTKFVAYHSLTSHSMKLFGWNC